MLKNRIKTVVMTIFLSLFITACNDKVEVGGDCKFTEERLLTRVISNSGGNIELEPMYGDVIRMSAQEFDSPVDVNEYYEFFIRNHTSGGCNPRSITHKEKVTVSNVLLGPTEQHAYAASFIVDEAKNCVYGQMAGCQDTLALDSSFDLSQLAELTHVEPHSVGHCSAATMKTIWPEIESAETQTRLISCVDKLDGGELAVEFSLTEDESTLLLRKVY